MRPLDSYPQSIGASVVSVFPHAGPTSYTQVTISEGSAVTGGDTVSAIEAGMKYFDVVLSGVTDDGVFRVVAIPHTASTSLSGAPSTTYTLMWFANKTATYGGQAQTINTQAAATTNLSTFTVRLMALGPK